MKLLPLLCLSLLAFTCAVPLHAQDQPGSGPATGQTQPEQQEQAQAEPTELDLPVDQTIKIKVDPVQISNVVDRVNEPSTVTVSSAGMLNAQLFLVPVDSPYGGRSLGKPRLIGTVNRAGDQLAIRWTSKEPTPYVKLFAVVHKKDAPGTSVRSRTIDLGIGPARLSQPPAAR
jgi:hypothetical protein